MTRLGNDDQSAAADARFASQLTELETSLGTPLVPGELVTWFETVATVLAELQPSLHRRTTGGHLAQFDQIMRDDPALQRSVEQLRAEDEALNDALQSFKASADRLAAKAAEIEPDEDVMSQEWNRFVEEGLWLVIRLRKQETAIRTWLSEAAYRDRGTGD
jgi:septal ring factor EnvC (AmiA/AmiB activator)